MNFRTAGAAFFKATKKIGQSFFEESHKEHKERKQRAQKIHTSGDYRTWISAFHVATKPETYFEIGVAKGETLALASLGTRVLGIDPNPEIINNLPAPTQLFKQPSDLFFEHHDISDIVGASPDLAFVDGLHEFQQAYRDIINTALNSKDDAVILVHDVLPVDQKSASPERKTRHWPGDVYKAIAFIKDNIPSLHITLIYAYPTGLAFIAGCGHLKAKQDDLQKVAHVLKDYQSLTVDDYYSDYVAHITQVRNTSEPIHSVVADLLEDRNLDTR